MDFKLEHGKYCSVHKCYLIGINIGEFASIDIIKLFLTISESENGIMAIITHVYKTHLTQIRLIRLLNKIFFMK
jgi:hypothetical protein